MTDHAPRALGDAERSLADKLNHLYRSCLPAGRTKPFTDREVAEAVRRAGGDISASYLHALRTGKRTNPTKQHMEALAAFFGVPAAFFLSGDTSHLDAELRRLQELRELNEALENPRVRAVALKARVLTEGGVRNIDAILDHVLELERGEGRTPPEPGP
ncbi:helix-turn-helix domain-containing protein [Salinispora arenicola]|uniref:helix-turn-helix domain-containing protein n=1 Tax=Salinispora arenicola TaxID=168697 RepID=UPI0003630ABC|nr:helix-turn-helix domain-containing protein [Salinispora arenicola]MCN0178456.1 helix-turn-helix domain-containing protein [Salinispora arenicola]